MKIAILDRDGTLNALGEDFIASPDDWEPVPGAFEAVARLNRAGWHVVVATNQPGLGRGLFDVLALNAIHAKMHRQMAAAGGRIDAVFYCPHADSEPCTCRKPLPGLMEQIRDRYGVEGADVLAIGSCAAHLQAAAAMGARQLHAVCTGRAADLSPDGALPEGWPAGSRLHASLTVLVDTLLDAAGATRPWPAPDAGGVLSVAV
ncbi:MULTISPECIES: D-glycero-beta-D-manno-heptose 1,7-bisphosphate 7-phosphatase [unclassified Acidovorax]|uniref:D-glycero-beta-D-manno-heptose 1,7-bisphosphate 7-phosphatase n=1 Tax=unclassified Acidovorax TaxID=2684926 RepID=UPI0028830439|nr:MULTISPECIES: D-glycero-beta-D-manno-heptose 1,7-bisphosphate 7-phosphatase [unclassified Acidovorax]